MKLQTVALFLIGALVSCPTRADNPKNSVEVRGVGLVTVPSDTVVVRLTVGTMHADVAEVRRRNGQIANPIYSLAESQQVARPTLLSTRMEFAFEPPRPDVYQRPLYQQPGDRPQTNVPFQGKGGKKGGPYEETATREPPIRMSRELELKFRDFDGALRFLSEVTKWDVVRTTCELQVAPLGFAVADPKPHLLEARRRAVAAAREHAQLLVDQQPGMRLGDAISIDDESADMSEIGHPVSPYRPPVVPGASADPFGAAGPAESRSPPVRLVAMQQERPKAIDLNHIAPAQMIFTASVRMVFQMTAK